MRFVLAVLLHAPLLLALAPGIEFNSGVVGPLGSGDNRNYNPSVFVESSLMLGLGQSMTLRAAYGQVFADGGEYSENTGFLGDTFGNYRTDAFFLKAAARRCLGGFHVGGGLGYWSYETTRDVILWEAD